MRRQATTVWGGGREVGTSPLPLVVAGAILLALVGGSLLTGALTHPLHGLAGLAALGLAVGAVVTVVLERRWNRTRPGPRLSTDPETGVPSTLVPCAPWTGAQRWSGLVLLLVLLGAGVLAALASGHGVVAVLVGAPVVALAHLLSPWTPAEGVHLSTRGVTVRHHGRPRHVAWDDVRTVRLTTWCEIERVRGRRVRLTPRQLAVRSDHLHLFVSVCLAHPEGRQVLGTPASLDASLWGVGT